MKKFTLILSMLAIMANAQTVNWTKSYGTTNNDMGRTVKVDVSGNSYVGGHHKPVGASFDEGFIRKYNNSGNLIWTKNFTGYVLVKSLAVDEQNNFVYVTGQFSYNANFAGVALTASGSLGDVFVAKMDSAGTVLWVKKFGNTNNDCGRAICVDNAGNVVISGYYKSTITFSSTVLPNYTNETRFLTKLDPSGNVIWAKQIGTRGNDVSATQAFYMNNEFSDPNSALESGYGLACDSNNDIFVVGTMGRKAYFDLISFNYTKSTEFLFLAKFNSSGGSIWVKTSADNYYNVTNLGGLAIDLSGNIITGGRADVNSVIGTYTVSSTGGFVTKFDNNGNTVWLTELNYVNGFSNLYSGCPSGYSVDGSGKPNFIGTFGGNNLTVGTLTLTAPSTEKMFIISLNPNGTSDWGFAYGQKTTGTMYENALAVGSNTAGAINITGKFDGSGDAFGTYTLASAGATDVFNMRINGNITLGVKQNINEKDFSFFPNPTNGEVIHFDNRLFSKTTRITIYNNMLQEIAVFSAEYGEIYIGELSAGTYFVEFKDNNAHIIKRLIKN